MREREDDRAFVRGNPGCTGSDAHPFLAHDRADKGTARQVDLAKRTGRDRRFRFGEQLENLGIDPRNCRHAQHVFATQEPGDLGGDCELHVDCRVESDRLTDRDIGPLREQSNCLRNAEVFAHQRGDEVRFLVGRDGGEGIHIAESFGSKKIDVGRVAVEDEHIRERFGKASCPIVVLLDELTYMLGYDYLNKEEVLNAIRNRPENQSVVVTGRGAIKELRDLADTVSEVKDEKHAYRAGIKARKGVDW